MDYNKQENTKQESASNGEVLIKVLRMFLGLPIMLLCGLVAIVGAVETLKQAFAFIEAGVFPVGAVMFEACLVGLFITMAGGGLRLAFDKANEKIPPGLFLWLGITFFCGAIAFTIIDTTEKDDWEYVSYPPYIEEWDTQMLYMTRECTYNNTIYFSGYMDFLRKGFRENTNIEIIKDDSLTDRYRVEVRYKGKKAEMGIYTDTYDVVPTENIYIHIIDYDYDTSVEDYAYMYKYGVDFEYSDPLAIEKIIIRTAYPELINVDGIND